MRICRLPGIAGSSVSYLWLIASGLHHTEAIGTESACNWTTCDADAEISNLLQHKRMQSMDIQEVHTSGLQTLSLTRLAGGTAASVRFKHQGRLLAYRLYAESVFSTGAQQVEVTVNGTKQMRNWPVRTFRSRQKGAWAAATLRDDGSVYGLFQDHVSGNLLKVMPSPTDSDTADSNQHFEPGARDTKSVDKNWHIIVPKSANRTGDAEDGRTDNEDPNFQRRSVPRWFPGCFPADDTPRIMTVGLIADAVASENHGKFGSQWGLGDVPTQMQTVINTVSMIFEAQLNIKLQVAYQKIYAAGQGPAWSTECDSVPSKRQRAQASEKEAEADYHALFSGCDNLQPMGQSPGGAVCSGGLLYILMPEIFGAGPEAGWITFAHESGHMFGATKHPVEWCMARGIIAPGDNSCRGGLMDAYSPATVPMWEPSCQNVQDSCLVKNGAYAFHEVHRSEMCTGLSKCNLAAVTTDSGKNINPTTTEPATTTPPPCADATTTGYTSNGSPASCSQLASSCDDMRYGSGIRAVCPLSCGLCTPSPPSLAPQKATLQPPPTVSTTAATTTTKTCEDNPDFTDRWWFRCEHWNGHDCIKKRAFYSYEDLHRVAANCLKSCNLCAE
eukprot:TRINITY_DN103621_c0_g1_i1.p1 TRINITY_DN103621_c0_g1~~TRINITY_DN103621_c0_g1_i1.p1  ORF type:complete len:614 (+),score=68.68 TRINITY_DN103621_c0_g1_i1:60-1901(+)